MKTVTPMDTARKRAALARDWRTRVPGIAQAFHDLLPDAEVYLIGSAVRGNMVGGSDVDLLVISDRVPKGALDRSKLKVEVEDMAGLPDYHPFQFHLVTRGEARPFLSKARNDILPVPRRVEAR
jgi:predicted nucleotidyltransferase